MMTIPTSTIFKSYDNILSTIKLWQIKHWWLIIIDHWRLETQKLTINLWIEKRSTILVTFMSWDIPKLNKKVSVCVTFYAIRRAANTSIRNMLGMISLRHCELTLMKNICKFWEKEKELPSHPLCSQLFVKVEKWKNPSRLGVLVMSFQHLTQDQRSSWSGKLQRHISIYKHTPCNKTPQKMFMNKLCMKVCKYMHSSENNRVNLNGPICMEINMWGLFGQNNI